MLQVSNPFAKWLLQWFEASHSVITKNDTAKLLQHTAAVNYNLCLFCK